MFPSIKPKERTKMLLFRNKKTSRKKSIFGKIFSPQNRAKMAGESISGGHIADKQRQLAQRAKHAGEISSFGTRQASLIV